MIAFKINGATPKGGKPICGSCKHATVVTGQNCEERILCSADVFKRTSGIVTIRVATCSSYHPINVPWLHEMEQMAWVVQARRRGPTGFQPEQTEMEVTIKPPSSYPSSPSDGVEE